MKICIGGGDNCPPGFINVDRHSGGEAFPLSVKASAFENIGQTEGLTFKTAPDGTGRYTFPDESVDEIYASHVLEHFGHRESIEALREWVRVLKPGGRIKIAVPNFTHCVENYLAGTQGRWAEYIFGGQIDENDYHKTCFDEEHLSIVMNTVGLVDLKPWKSELADSASLECSLNLEGTKGSAARLLKAYPKDRKIVAVMSMPRLAFTQNMFCALQAFVPLQIPFEKAEGAWWDQCLERVMLPHMGDGTEYVITLDYDAVFRQQHVHQLVNLMEENPDADAICPIQFKRGEGTHLFRPIDPATGEYRTGTMGLNEMECDLTPIGWGHFGLTIFRVSSLRKMPHPWFAGKPAPDGTWGEGRVDPDIGFWEKWRAIGNKLYLANHVAIGHLELMASLPNKNLERFHVHVEDITKQWPTEAR